MVYNESIFNESNTIYDLASGINTESGMLLGALILFLTWFVVFIVGKNYDTKVMFLVSSFVTSIVGIFLCFGLHWISLTIFWIPIVLTGIAVVVNIAFK